MRSYTLDPVAEPAGLDCSEVFQDPVSLLLVELFQSPSGHMAG
jgi:hypothetical protein